MQLLKKIGNLAHAVIALLVLMTTTTICFIPILFIGVLKLIPSKDWQTLCTRAIDQVATLWAGVNNLYLDKIQKTKIEISGLEQLNPKEWYLVVANHQSWLDVVMLHRAFNRKIPVLKFFVKDQLKWVPLLGFCWWAMGCPFMKRYSKEYLAKNPHKKGQDLLSTQKAVDKFKRAPVSVMSFVEGTRFTSTKKEQQNSPYTHLLKPKAGGISFVISTMGDQLSCLLDVSIVYAEEKHSLWDFLCKRVSSAKISVRRIPIPAQFNTPELVEHNELHNEFKAWLNQQWTEKDNHINSLKEQKS